ncbi:MAG TPA: hypothetical protein VFH47_00650 [Candidatus Thermoplasmatota archaeon]|nr:hypothetical protein [Candidatus Thermoplasmatota archaeon]
MAPAAFQDTDVGMAAATLLHAAGAIGLLGALVAYLAWARHARAGRHEPSMLALAMAGAVASATLNLVGGFLRTFQSDHPRLTAWGDSSWVRVLAVKHVFVFAAVAALLLLAFRYAPRLRRRVAGGATGPLPGERALAGVAAAGILAAAVLGAVGTVLPLRDDVPREGGAQPEPPLPAPDVPTTVYLNATGTFTNLPPGAATTHAFTVLPGTQRLEATLLWTPEPFCLRLELLEPEAAAPAVAPCLSGGSGRFELALDAPRPGTWRYRVSGNGMGVDWDLTLRMPQASAGGETVVADTVTIAPGAFHEINTVMPASASLRWDWSADAVLHFDVHSHFDDEVQYWVEQQTDAHAGGLRVEREGGYSYLWANEGSLPVTVRYRVWGPFTVDSIFP